MEEVQAQLKAVEVVAEWKRQHANIYQVNTLGGCEDTLIRLIAAALQQK